MTSRRRALLSFGATAGVISLSGCTVNIGTSPDSSEDDVEADSDTGTDDTGEASSDTTPPSISAFSITNPSNKQLRTSFDSDEQLSIIQVSVSGTETATLGTDDFTKTTSNGNHTYEATYSASSDGDYTATLEEASDENGNNGADLQSASVTVTTPQKIDDYLENARRYDDRIVDYTGQNEVTISVGAGSIGFAFDPSAIRIDAGTTVIWEWTGEGGLHNVASTEESDSQFNSGEPVGEEGHSFRQSFDSAGIQLYHCTPHQANGMLGAIEVIE